MSLPVDVLGVCVSYLDDAARLYATGQWAQLESPLVYAAQNELIDLLDAQSDKALAIAHTRSLRVARFLLRYIPPRIDDVQTLEVLQYLYRKNRTWRRGLYARLALAGRVEPLRFAIAHGPSVGDEPALCALAARGGSLACLRFLREELKLRWDARTCHNAALGGHTDVLRYAHRNGCPLNHWALFVALVRGHLDCVVYAHLCGGLMWDARARERVARAGHSHVLDYMDQVVPLP